MQHEKNSSARAGRVYTAAIRRAKMEIPVEMRVFLRQVVEMGPRGWNGLLGRSRDLRTVMPHRVQPRRSPRIHTT